MSIYRVLYLLSFSCGLFLLTGTYHGVKAEEITPQSLIWIGSSGDIASFAGDISDNGVMAGQSGSTAFRWENGTLLDLGTLGGSYSVANGISADGSVVVGESNTDSLTWQRRGFRWENGSLEDIGTLGNVYYTYAEAISADGTVIAGTSHNSDNAQRAFRWEDGTLEDLGHLGGGQSDGRDVSVDGLVVVGSSIDENSDYHAFRWENGTMYDLRTSGVDSYANGVSADGSIVVGAIFESGQYRAVR